VNLPFAGLYLRPLVHRRQLAFDPSISAPSSPARASPGPSTSRAPPARAIQLFSNTINGQPFAGAVNDPRDVVQLFRYLSGTLSPAFGDQPCNNGNPAVTRICFVNNTSPQDMRIFQSSSPLNLGPGESGSIVVAYIFAAPVKTDGCGTTCDVKPGNAQLLTDVVSPWRQPADSSPGSAARDATLTTSPADRDDRGPRLLLASAGGPTGRQQVPAASPPRPGPFLIPRQPDDPVETRQRDTGDPLRHPSQATRPGRERCATKYRQLMAPPIYRGRVDALNEMTCYQFDYAGTASATSPGW
jgi:hypothetical protein